MISNDANLLCKYRPTFTHANWSIDRQRQRQTADIHIHTLHFMDVACKISLNEIILYLILWNNLDNNWSVTCRFIARINIDFRFTVFVGCDMRYWLVRCLRTFWSAKRSQCTAGILLLPPAIIRSAVYSSVLCFVFVDQNAMQFNSFFFAVAAVVLSVHSNNSATNRKLYGFIIRKNSFVNGKLILVLCVCLRVCNGSKWHG